ncbi:MAG: cell envelope integrity protein TolA [bacterium]|nr:cell envelope integrity protein TolA [bacterium]
MNENKKHSLSFNVLLVAVICGSFVFSNSSNAAKKKKKTSTVTTGCIACLNAFDAETLEFTIDKDKCPKRLAKCYKANYTNQCEGIIEDCIAYNCKNAGSCGDEAGNRNLFAGCLKSVNQILPFQCASYIAGYASSKAEEVKSLQTAQENALKQKQLEVQKAEQEAKTAAENAKVKAQQIASDTETKKLQIAGENELKLTQEKARLEQQAKDAELARQKKEAQEAKNNKPNVKYNNLLNTVKQDITSAKTYTTKAYNLLGITKTNDQQTNGSAVFFPPQIITVSALASSTDAKTRSLVNSSRYKSDQNFVCTKNTKENFIKNELNNVYNTIKKSRDNLSKGIAEIEATNADDETTDTISESKINTLYLTQNKLTEIMETVEGYTANLKTSCETRCEGMSSMTNMSSSISSAPIQFDENGNIIEEKKTDENAYSCKDFETSSSSNTTGFASMIGGSSNISDMFGGIGKKVTELTKRTTESVLYTDRILDEALIAVQSGKFDGFSSSDYPAIDSCVQYMVLDIAQYTSCTSNVLGQQLTALSTNKSNSNIKTELRNSINTILKTITSPNYKDSLEDEKVYCQNLTNGDNLFNKDTNNNVTGNNITANNLNDYNDFNTCALSITNALNKVKDKKGKTGMSNFQIATANKENNLIYLSNGDMFTPTDFAQKKLGWKNATCTMVIISSSGNNNMPIMTSNGQVIQLSNSNTGIDMLLSGLQCDCGNGKHNNPNFQKLNSGNYSSDCSEEQ